MIAKFDSGGESLPALEEFFGILACVYVYKYGDGYICEDTILGIVSSYIIRQRNDSQSYPQLNKTGNATHVITESA